MATPGSPLSSSQGSQAFEKSPTCFHHLVEQPAAPAGVFGSCKHGSQVLIHRSGSLQREAEFLEDPCSLGLPHGNAWLLAGVGWILLLHICQRKIVRRKACSMGSGLIQAAHCFSLRQILQPTGTKSTAHLQAFCSMADDKEYQQGSGSSTRHWLMVACRARDFRG